MLLPHQLDELSNEILEPVHEAESELLTALAAFLFAASEYGAYSNEIQAARNVFDQDVTDIKRRHLRTVERRTSDIITRASNQSIRAENYRGNMVIFAQITNRHVTAMRGKVAGMFQNLGFNRLNFPQAIDAALDEIQMQSSSYSPPSSREILENLFTGIAETGLQNSLENMSMDAWIRRNLLDEVKTATNEASRYIGEIMGYDGVQLSAHAGARPSHAEIQGMLMSRFPGVSGYEWWSERAEAMWQEPNCRHSFQFVPLNRGNAYTREQLAAMNKAFDFEGKKLTPYEASQKMRRMERDSRKITRELIALESAGFGDGERAAALGIRQNTLHDLYMRLSRASGMSTQMERFWLKR